MNLWDETSSLMDEEMKYGSFHADLQYEDLENAGSPVRPLEFPTPRVYDCALANITALDHRTGLTHDLKNVLLSKPARTSHGKMNSNKNKHNNNDIPRRAYLIKKKLCKSTYGTVRLCVVLERRDAPQAAAIPEVPLIEGQEADNPPNTLVQWQSTEELVVLKCSSWTKIRQLRGMHLEDPIREISATQLLGAYHPHVLGCIEALQDENWLYLITPYCSGGYLHAKIFPEPSLAEDPFHQSTTTSSLFKHKKSSCARHVDESRARHLFKQLLLGLYHLQRKGICHRDICLENVLLDKDDNVVIVDFGLSLRVPYVDPCNLGNNVTDVSEGTCRRLIKCQGQGGNSLMYLAPEIVAGDGTAFDGYAIDLWSAGVILFVLLVGVEPFQWAHPTDNRYEMISNGQLHVLLEKSFNISLSREACDLLQNMMWRDPHDRLSLYDVMKHPWVVRDENKDNDDHHKSILVENLGVNENNNNNNNHKVQHNHKKNMKPKREWVNPFGSSIQVLMNKQKARTTR